MAYEQKDMSGTLFKNDKQGVEARPDRTGSCLIGGREYWISGWIKEGKSGQQFLSLSFKAKDAKPVENLDGKRAGQKPRIENMDADTPW